MADPTPSIAERIVSGFKTRMAVVLKANGYHTDLGANVLLGPCSGDVAAPGLVIHAPKEDGEEQPNARLSNLLELHFEAWAPRGHAGENASTEAGLLVQRMVADLKRAARRPDSTLSHEAGACLIRSLRYAGFVVPPQDDDAVGVFVTFKVVYFEQVGDPGQLL